MVSSPALSPENNDSTPITMWVVLSDETDLWFLKILKRGFRHAFIIMQQDMRWVLIDPRSDKTDIQILPHPHHFNFLRYFTEQGKTVIKVPVFSTPRKMASVMPLSCIETIKRVIGLHRWWVVTPYRLYKTLQKIQQKGL